LSAHRGTDFGLAVSGLIGVVLLIFLIYSLTVARFTSDAGSAGTPEQIAARIEPVGSVNLASADATAPGPSTPAQAAPAPNAADGGPGAAVYNKACVACHATGAANAPKIDDKAAWEPRAAQGVAQLLQTAIAGKGAMPPRGTCADCSDEDLKAAIEYMLDKAGLDAAVPPVVGGVSADAPAMSAAEPVPPVAPGAGAIPGTAAMGSAASAPVGQ